MGPMTLHDAGTAVVGDGGVSSEQVTAPLAWGCLQLQDRLGAERREAVAFPGTRALAGEVVQRLRAHGRAE